MIKRVSACLHLLGVSSPSPAPVWGSECSSDCELVLCKAAAHLVVETQNRRHNSANPTRQEETSADWLSLCTRASLCIARPCFCTVAVCVYVWWCRAVRGTFSVSVCLVTQQCTCSWICVCASLAKNVLHCVYVCLLAHGGLGCVHLTPYVFETVCMWKCKWKCQWKLHANTRSVVWQWRTHKRKASQTQALEDQTNLG